MSDVPSFGSTASFYLSLTPAQFHRTLTRLPSACVGFAAQARRLGFDRLLRRSKNRHIDGRPDPFRDTPTRLDECPTMDIRPSPVPS